MTIHTLPRDTRLADIKPDDFQEGDIVSVEARDIDPIRFKIYKCPQCGKLYMRSRPQTDPRCIDCKLL